MGLLIFALIMLGVVLVIAKMAGPYLNSGKAGTENVKDVGSIKFFNKKLLTPTEISFFSTLIQATPGKYVFVQVALSQLVGVPSGPEKLASFNRISRMSIDFVVCDEKLNTLVAIELDDPTHDRPSSAEKDLKKDTVLATAGIRLIRIRIEKIPSVEELELSIAG
jgi:hypothetical protein